LQNASEYKAVKRNQKLKRWYRPGDFTLSQGPHGELRLNDGHSTISGIFPVHCFPVHFPDKYISLNFTGEDGRSAELGIVESLLEWPAEVQNLLRKGLQERYLYHSIEEILSIKRFCGFVDIAARTDLGEMNFTLRDTVEAVQDYGPRGKLMIDVEDNLYVIKDLEQLPPSQRQLFLRVIFW
jgi:ATP-binding cassette, subfamily B, bacterial